MKPKPNLLSLSCAVLTLIICPVYKRFIVIMSFSSKSFISIHRSCYPLLITYGPAKTVAASVLSVGAGASLRHGAGTVCFYNPKQIMNYDKTDFSSLAL